LNGRVCIETSTRLPPLPQQINRLPRQHDIAILAALGLLDTNDLLSAVDMLDLQPDHFAGTQAAPIYSATIWMRLRIASRSDAPEYARLPHLFCSRLG